MTLGAASLRHRERVQPRHGRRSRRLVRCSGTIAVPTLVIHGELDPILPLPNGRALASLVPRARLHVVHGAGHELNPLDLDEIVTTLVDFIAETEAGMNGDA
jgi:pimeloyl-ACP methyl ester carboxylesterase